MKTLLSSYLRELHIPFTRSFADKLFAEHPHRYNLYGLSDMLSVYKIENAGVQVEDKNLKELTFPFVAHVGNDFVVVSLHVCRILVFMKCRRKLYILKNYSPALPRTLSCTLSNPSVPSISASKSVVRFSCLACSQIMEERFFESGCVLIHSVIEGKSSSRDKR